MVVRTPTFLANYELVINAFGYWPAFHDSTISRFTQTQDSIEFTLHVWEMTPKTDAKGYYILRKNHLVRFFFKETSDIQNTDHYPNDILRKLRLINIDGAIMVNMDSAMGCEFDASFAAKSGKLIEVTPCDKEGIPI